MHSVSAAGLSLIGGLPISAFAVPETESERDPWERARQIVDRLATPPSFRDKDFPITDFGAAPCEAVATAGWLGHDQQGSVQTPAADAKDCYPAIAAAIAACHQDGGGRVVIPAGNWYCAGPMVLRSHVHVHLKAGAQLFFSNQPADYARYGDVDCGKNGKLVRSRWQGNDCLNYSPLVYAYEQENIALTGENWSSILNGQGGVPFSGQGDDAVCWWTWKGKGAASETTANPLNPATLAAVAPDLSAPQIALIEGNQERWRGDFGYLPALSEAGVPIERRIFGLGHYLRPNMIQFIGCSNVLLQGYQVTNTPFWQHNPVNCRNLAIRHVYANSMGPNNDGFDPESCDHVLVDSCTFNTGDDCIAIKSGKDRDTQYGPSQNIVIQHCTMQSGHGAITLGSEVAAGIENVYAQNLVFENLHWATKPLNIAIRLKTNMNRGGFLRNIHVRKVSIPNGVRVDPGFYTPLPGSPVAPKSAATSAGGVITIDCDYAPQEDNVRTRPPSVSNVHISEVTVGNIAVKGGHYSCFQALVFQGPVAADYNGAQPAPAVAPLADITIRDCDFGTPLNGAHPVYLYNTQNVKLDNVTIGGKLFQLAPASAA